MKDYMKDLVFVEPFTHLPGHFKTYFLNLIKGSKDKNNWFISFTKDEEIGKSTNRFLYCSETIFPRIPFISKFLTTYACLYLACKKSKNIILIDGSYLAAFIISFLHEINLGIVFPGHPETQSKISFMLYRVDFYFFRRIKNATYIVHSPETQKLLDGICTSLIPWGVDHKKIIKEESNDYLHFGTIEPRKNLHEIIRLLENIDHKGGFIIAGPPTNENYLNLLRESCRKSSIKTEILAKYLNENEIDCLFARCSKLILAYDETFKGASGVFAVSASYNTPVIYNKTAAMDYSASLYGNGIPYDLSNTESFRLALNTQTRQSSINSLSWESVIDLYSMAFK